MSIQIIGQSNSTIANVDGVVYRALTVTVRPVEYGLLGMFKVSITSGPLAAGLPSASDIFQARWIDANRVALVWGVSLDGMSGTGFLAGFTNFSLFLARNWIQDGTGGVVVTPTLTSQQLKASMRSSIMGTIRGPTTTSLGVGTKTLDAQPMGQITFVSSANPGFYVNYVPVSVPLFGMPSAKYLSQPIVLAYNEGVVIQGTVPGSGTCQVGMSMFWSEVGIY
jgi:hypothetical protein